MVTCSTVTVSSSEMEQNFMLNPIFGLTCVLNVCFRPGYLLGKRNSIEFSDLCGQKGIILFLTKSKSNHGVFSLRGKTDEVSGLGFLDMVVNCHQSAH